MEKEDGGQLLIRNQRQAGCRSTIYFSAAKPCRRHFWERRGGIRLKAQTVAGTPAAPETLMRRRFGNGSSGCPVNQGAGHALHFIAQVDRVAGADENHIEVGERNPWHEAVDQRAVESGEAVLPQRRFDLQA